MKPLTALALLPLLLITACGGLSEKEQRAAKAHADNLCLLSQQLADGLFGADFA